MNYAQTFDGERAERYHLAMKRHPGFRDAERNLLVSLLGAKPNDAVLDYPSGDGFASKSLWATCRVTCVDPSKTFLAYVPKGAARRVEAPIEHLPFAESSFDRVLSLAGTHHNDRLEMFREAYRVLRPGGTFAAADVVEGTRAAHFLNLFVGQYNPQGHQGAFFPSTASVANELRDVGFRPRLGVTRAVPWVFRDPAAMVDGVTDLFGLECSDVRVRQGLVAYFGAAEIQHGVLPWSLGYVVAEKPVVVI